jgi:hypothetical protein
LLSSRVPSFRSLFVAVSFAVDAAIMEELASHLQGAQLAFKIEQFNDRLGLKRREGNYVRQDLGPELLVNGGFESGSFQPGWTSSLDTQLVGVTSFPPAVYEGQYGAYFGTISQAADLTQTIATVPGAPYNFSFALRSQIPDSSDNSTINNHFEANFGNQQVLVINNSTGFPYSVRSYAVIATSSTTVVRFSGTRNFQVGSLC